MTLFLAGFGCGLTVAVCVGTFLFRSVVRTRTAEFASSLEAVTLAIEKSVRVVAFPIPEQVEMPEVPQSADLGRDLFADGEPEPVWAREDWMSWDGRSE